VAGAGQSGSLVMTEHEVATSHDCFPIEFHDIKRQHRILHGTDVVSSISWTIRSIGASGA